MVDSVIASSQRLSCSPGNGGSATVTRVTQGRSVSLTSTGPLCIEPGPTAAIVDAYDQARRCPTSRPEAWYSSPVLSLAGSSMRRRAFITLLGGVSSAAVIRRALTAPPAAIADGTPIGRGKLLVVQEDAAGRIVAL